MSKPKNQPERAQPPQSPKKPAQNNTNPNSNSDNKSKRRLPQFKRPPMPKFDHLPFHRRPAIKEAVRETTSGGIVFRRDKAGKLEILLIQDVKGRWTIPKGHVEPGEETGATAEREIREETGLAEMEVFSELGKVNFRYRRVNSLILMTMHIWLVEAKGNSDQLNPEEWLKGIKWFPAVEAIDEIAYDDIGKLMLLAMKKIRKGTY